MTNYAERVAKGTMTVFTMLFLAGLLGYILRIFMARNLSLADYGLFYSVFTVITLPMLFRDLGLNSAIVKFIPEFHAKKKISNIKKMLVQSFIIQLVISALIILVMLALGEYLSVNFFRNPSSFWLITSMLGFFLFHAFFQFCKSSFQGFQKISLFALSEIFYIGFILLSIVIIFTFLNHSAISASYGYSVGTAFASLICFIFLWKIVGELPKKNGNPDKDLMKNLMKFSFPVMVTGVASLIMGYTDTICVTFFRSIEEVGLYQIALPTAQVMVYSSTALIAILFPVISEMWARKKYSSVSDGIIILIKFMLILILPLGMIFLAFPEIVLNVLFGSTYMGASHALQILSISFMFYTIGSILTTAVNGIGKPLINAKVIAFCSVLNLTLNLFLVPIYGIIGSATATLISYFTYFYLTKIFLDREFKKINLSLYIPRMPIAKIILGSIFSLLLILFLKELISINPIIEALLIMSISMTFYASWILFSGCLDKKDLKMIYKIKIPIPDILKKIIEKYAK